MPFQKCFGRKHQLRFVYISNFATVLKEPIFVQEIQTERLFRREPEYEALQQGEISSDPVSMEKYERLIRKWNNTCGKLEDHQTRFDMECIFYVLSYIKLRGESFRFDYYMILV